MWVVLGSYCVIVIIFHDPQRHRHTKERFLPAEQPSSLLLSSSRRSVANTTLLAAHMIQPLTKTSAKTITSSSTSLSSSSKLSAPLMLPPCDEDHRNDTINCNSSVYWRRVPVLVFTDDSLNTTTTNNTSIATTASNFNIRFLVEGPCSCLNQRNYYGCCQRNILVVHKMGSTAAQEVTDQYFIPMRKMVNTVEIMIDHPNGRFFQKFVQIPFTEDYRHVVLTRDWYDSILSGYLYHKEGKECWLDWYGQTILPNQTIGWLYNNTLEDWELRLNRYYHSNHTSASGGSRTNTAAATSTARRLRQERQQYYRSWPPGHGRDLCRYLADESEEDGLHVYTAWALINHLYPLLDFRHSRLLWEQEQGWNRTKFTCYESLVHPTTHGQTVYDWFRWFFPSQQPHVNATTRRKGSYEGGHASNRDPTLRRRLRNLLAQIDQQVYHGTIAQASREFGCRASSVMATPIQKGSTSVVNTTTL